MLSVPRLAGGRERPRPPRPQGAAERQWSAGRQPGTGLKPTTAGGLVICAKNVRDPVADRIAIGDLRAVDAMGLRFPSPESATAAAALFEPAAPWACGPGRRGIEPESGQRSPHQRRPLVSCGSGGPIPSGPKKPPNGPSLITNVTLRMRSCESGTTSPSLPGTVIRPSAFFDMNGQLCGKRPAPFWWCHHRVVPKSRSTMCRTFAELDYSPLVESGRVPAMVTLTYPGDWEVVAPDGASVKRHMMLWRKRFQREYSEPARYIWKLEFQRAVHPTFTCGRHHPCHPVALAAALLERLSETWTQVVDHPDPEARHRLAGTAIDVRNGLKARPKRLAIYFTKHSSPNLHGDKEYQHIVPGSWRQPGHGPGRFWGVNGLESHCCRRGGPEDAYFTVRLNRVVLVAQPGGVREFG